MKYLKIVLLLTLFSACKLGQPDIGGVYVNTELGQSEFSKVVSDTVRISPDIGRTSCTVARSTCYQRINNGIFMKTECSTEMETAIYNKDSHSLLTSKNGIMIMMDNNGRQLTIGTSHYYKIK